jgi:FAD/FMN-containing dehydrogenase
VDVRDAVRFAASESLAVRVQATGHGALAAYDGGVLIDTSALERVSVDGAGRLATVGAGVRWQALLDAAQAYGLAGLSGSSATVGVVGYALGGGAGWLARRFGLCSDSIEAVEITTADGVQRWIDDTSEPDLFWAIRGGGGNFGVVSALRLRLVQVPTVFAGALCWPMALAREVLVAYRSWVETVPPDVGSAVAFLQYPKQAQVPDPVRGMPTIALRICHPGPVAAGETLLTAMRRIPGCILDTTRLMPYSEIGSVTMDSPLHLPRIGYSESLSEISDSIIDILPDVLAPGAPYLAMELRHAGRGTACPPHGHEGLGYWQSPFLFFGMSVTPDDVTERAASDLGDRLQELFAPVRTGMNALTFLLPQYIPNGGGDAERVQRVYQAEHYGRLAVLKRQYDPSNMFGGDRNIPPSD